MNNFTHNTKHKNPTALTYEAETGLPLGELPSHQKPSNYKVLGLHPSLSPGDSELCLTGRATTGGSTQSPGPIKMTPGTCKTPGWFVLWSSEKQDTNPQGPLATWDMQAPFPSGLPSAEVATSTHAANLPGPSQGHWPIFWHGSLGRKEDISKELRQSNYACVPQPGPECGFMSEALSSHLSWARGTLTTQQQH